MKNLFTKLTLLALFTFCLESYNIAAPVNSFISSVSPGINSVNAGRSENIVIYFSQDMDPATINSTGILVSGYESGMLTTNIVYNAASKTAIIDPTADFKTGELINVSINSIVKTNLNVNIDPVTYLFNVASPRGDGNFTSIPVSQSNLKPADILSGDFDNDGATDLMTFNKESHTAAFLKNNGSGVFNLNSSFIIDPEEIKSFSSADYDKDGDLDLAFVIGVYGLFDFKIFLNNGNGTFTGGFRDHIYTSGRVGTSQMKSFDIDNDGDIDLLPLSNDRFSGMVSILINNGNAEFIPPGRLIYPPVCSASYPIFGELNSFAIADVNNDGDLDALLASYHGEFDEGCNCTVECRTITIMSNNGHGIFSFYSSYDLPASNYGIICTGDFNNDGYADIMCKGLLMKNNGDGNFTFFPSSIYAGNGITGDFDSDGDLDIVTLEGNSIMLYKNIGDGTFSAPVNFGTGLSPVALCSGNFDADCDLDIATCNSESNDVTALFNSSGNLLSGPDLITANSENTLYTIQDRGGYWEILNHPPCNAVINGSNQNQTVYVNAGSNPGSFILYHHSLDDCGWQTGNKAVYVDDPLPVELSAFVSAVNGNNVKLNWTTVSEMNNSGFDIERRDARSETQDVWNKISFINGHGTTTSPNNFEFTDRNLPSGKYNYRLKQIDFNGNFNYHNLSDEVVIGVPDKFLLSQNYPNPFNPVTNLEFGISNLEFVSLKVYNSLGKEVVVLVNEIKPAGRYEVTFDGSNLASGVYYYKIAAGNFTAVKRMILLK